MGNYGHIPRRLPLQFNTKKDEFQAAYVQRIKQTPFCYAEVYSLQPPIFIDGIDIRLGQLVQPRIVSQQYFPPSEVLKIIQNVISGLSELEEHGYKAHGDLSFDTIFYDKRNKIFKITHPIFSPQSGYKLSRAGKRFSLLSPQQLLHLTDPHSNEQNIVSIKSDLFTLGVIMCQICTLIPSNQIYCPETYIIFDKEIQNRFQIIKECYEAEPRYCQLIVNIIKNLLEYDEANRKNCKEILWQIQQSGLTKQPTQVPQGPPQAVMRPTSISGPGQIIMR